MVTLRSATTNSQLFAKKYVDMIGVDLIGKTLVITPVIKTVSNNSGDETLTDGTSYSSRGSFFKANDTYSLKNPGLIKGADAIVTFPPDTVVLKDYKITWNSETFRVDDVEDYQFGDNTIYKYCRVFLI